MSRFTGGYRQSADDLAYGDYPPSQAPQRWDRDRFDNFGRGPPPPPEPPRGRFEEDYRYTEQQQQQRPPPGVAVQDRPYSRGPPPRHVEERERIYQDTFNDGRPRRRTDKELFGEVDPRELAQMALAPYKPQSPEYDPYAAPSRPGLLRRQSSLNTFDRRPAGPRYDREEHRMPPYTPIPLPIRRPDHAQEDYHYLDHHHPDENYREVEIKRERSVHRRSGRAKSHKSSKAPSTKAPSTKAPSTKAPSTVRSASSSSSSSSSSYVESRVSSSPQRTGKKGKTRMPKRLVHRDALHDLAYPYDEEEDFFMLRIALEKDQIDEVIKISEMYKAGDKKTVYRYEEKIDEAPAPPQEFGHEELIRKEYINPPSDFAPSTVKSHHSRHESHHSRSRRAPSPSVAPSASRHLSPPRSERSHRTRGRSASEAVFQERKTVVEERIPAPPAPPQAPEFYEDRRTIIEERVPPPSHAGTLVIQDREYRSQRDIEAEIRALESERRALRLEREDQDKMALRVRDRTDEEYQLVEYRDRRDREIIPIVERNPSPPRNVIRVEKDRKAREKEKRAKKIAIAMATLT